MPQNTPRGYTYPCYSDPQNFPAQMQDLAQDIDADVQGIITNIGDARNNPPSLRVSGSANVALVAGTAAAVTYTTEEYDNNAMFTAPSATATINVEGLYLISTRVLFLGAGGIQTAGLTLNGLLRGAQSRQGTAAANTTVNCHVLAYCAAATTIQTVVESSVATSYTIRTMTLTRMTGTTLL